MQSNSKRVVITGVGMVSPLGASVKGSWNRLIAGKSGIRKIFSFDASELPCQIAGEIPPKDEEYGFDPNLHLDEREQSRTGKFIHYGIAAADEAIADSGWVIKTEEDAYRTGLSVGSGIGGLPNIEDASILLKEKGHRRLSPFFIPSALINLTAGHISIKYNYKGPSHAAVTACASGANSIGDAYEMIKRGVADVMIAGGSEGSVCNLGIAGFCATRALAVNFNDNPQAGSRPWDRDRSGFVMGEGSGVLVLEELDHAVARGANIYGEIVAYGMSSDAHHITAPHPEGNGGYRCMKMALERAGIRPDEVGYINAHGTSTPMGDRAEFLAVSRLFEGNLSNIAMSSTKSSTGHMLGAAGAVEAVFSVLALQQGIVPPTLNLDNPDEEFGSINLVAHTAQERKLQYAISNSFGFGGVNCSLLFKKF